MYQLLVFRNRHRFSSLQAAIYLDLAWFVQVVEEALFQGKMSRWEEAVKLSGAIEVLRVLVVKVSACRTLYIYRPGWSRILAPTYD